MTQQYIAGEFSLRLAQLQAVTPDEVCWDSLTRADTTAFDRQAATAAQLREFGVCAGLIDEA
jgi:hypothetical protein